MDPDSQKRAAAAVALEYVQPGMRVGLGTDGVAGSNNDVDMFDEMDLSAKLQKVMLNDPEALSAAQAFELATLGGARALGMEQEIGSLEPGKKADLITISLDAPHATPLYNVYSQLVYALKASDVRDVMVNGRLVVRNRQLLTLKLADVLANAAKAKASVLKSLQP